MNPFVLLVCGSRDYDDANYLNGVLDLLLRKYPDLALVEGEALGADARSRIWATERGVHVHRFPADWARHGKRAGYLRNAEMAAYLKRRRNEGSSVAVVGFFANPASPSRGTTMMLELAAMADIPCWTPQIPLRGATR